MMVGATRDEKAAEANGPVKMPSSTHSSPNHIELRNITKAFGHEVAVRSLSLNVAHGEFFCLLGPSGCGKTTTLNTIAGFIRPDTGEILFDETPITGIPVHKRNIGMVFQNYALFPNLTVYENIAFGLRRRGVPVSEEKRRVADMIKMVRLEGNESRFPNELSGGQQQRVALARALVIRPTVLLLDEPLSNLDAKLREQMRLELRRIQKEADVTTVFVTHDQEEALSMADRVAVMNRGVLQQVAAPHEIYNRPANRFVAGFIGQANLLSGTVALNEAGATVIDTTVGKLTTKVDSPFPVGSQAMLMIRPERIALLESETTTEFAVCLDGQVRSVVFRGSARQVEITIQQENLIAVIPAGPLDRELSVGDAVRIGWKQSDAMLMTSEAIV